jgi:biopolymer transport protein ExbD
MISDAELEGEFDDHIDLTPLIDAMFLLLIFFILATTFAKPVMDVVLPHAKSSAKSSTQDSQMVVSIDHQGRIFYKGAEIPLDQLPHLMERQPDLPLNFYVDQRAPFKAFVGALDQARLKRRDQIVITTDPADDRQHQP